MKTEHRTQIYLSEAEYQRTTRFARQRSISLAGVVREALAEYLSARDSTRALPPRGKDPADRLVGLWSGKGSPGDLAQRHDDYLADEAGAEPAGARRHAR